MSDDSLSPLPPAASPQSPEPAPPTAASAVRGAGGESSPAPPPGGGLPDANRKKRLRHRGGRARNKPFPAGEGEPPHDDGEDADDADVEDAADPVDAEMTADEPAASPAAAPEPAAPPVRGERDTREGREPRRDSRPTDRGPRPDQRPPRPDRVDPRGPRHERPERFDRSERISLDPRELSEKAWQLYFGELREEGLALIDENDAEKLTNRCFKLAEIFMRQRQRRINQLSHGGTTLNEERRAPAHGDSRQSPPPKLRPEIPIEHRLPDDPAKLSKEETEALIEEAREAAEKRAEAPSPPEPLPEAPAGEPPTSGSPAP